MTNSLRWLQKATRTFINYRELLLLLVQKDLKLKYRRSFLGYLWSVMNPLFVMIVLTIVFSKIFSRKITNFPVYLLIGRTFFDFLSEATRQGMSSVVSNASLLKKVYVPRYIFTVARVSSSAVNLLFSLGALAIVMIFTRSVPTWHILFLPVPLCQIYVFCLGLGLFLAATNVFFRDIQYIYNVVMTAWMYMSAIFYPIDILPNKLQWFVKYLNPLYFYISQARSVIQMHELPDNYAIVAGCFSAFATLLLGGWLFRKVQNRFILYI